MKVITHGKKGATWWYIPLAILIVVTIIKMTSIMPSNEQSISESNLNRTDSLRSAPSRTREEERPQTEAGLVNRLEKQESVAAARKAQEDMRVATARAMWKEHPEAHSLGGKETEQKVKTGNLDQTRSSNSAQQDLQTFQASLASKGIMEAVVARVSEGAVDDQAIITVQNAWHREVYQIRLQAAQNLWRVWASIRSPSQPDKARIKIVDLNGNEVGGSRMWGGSLVWVNE